MESKIILALLSCIGINNPTSEDFSNVCKLIRVDKLPTKMKFILWISLPAITQYIQYLLDPEKTVDERL